MFATPSRGPSNSTPATAEGDVINSPLKTNSLLEQVELLRQREASMAAEMASLRRMLGESQAANGSTFQTPPKSLSASATRNDLMDEVERLRREKRELQVQNCELEVQIQDAANSIEGFSTAIESLEAGYKQKEDTWKRQIAELQQECQTQVHANRELKRNYDMDMQSKDLEIEELQAAAHTLKSTTNSTTSSLTKDLQNAQATLRAKDALLSSFESELTQVKAHCKELTKTCQQKEDDVIAWKNKHNEVEKQLELTELRLKQANAATSASGQSILVKTLRDEVRLIQSRLEMQFKKDKETLLQRVTSLQTQLNECQTTFAEKDRTIFTLNATIADNSRQYEALQNTNQQLEASVARLTKDLATAQDEFVKLQQCRGFLDHHLDSGFQELLREEEALLSTKMELEATKAECLALQREVEFKAVWQKQAAELQSQLENKERELAANTSKVNHLNSLEAEHKRLTALVANLQEDNNKLKTQVDATANLTKVHQQYNDALVVIKKLEAKVTRRESSEARLKDLLSRMQAVSERNLQLDDRLAKVLSQSKKDQTDIVALRALVQSSKQKIQRYESDRAVYREIEQKYRDSRSMLHVYKKDIESLQSKVKALESQPVVSGGPHEAQLQHMQRVMESHTKELVSEIETLQAQYQSLARKYKRSKQSKEHLESQLQEKTSLIAKLEAQARRPSPVALRTKAPIITTESPPLKIKDLNPASEMESILNKLERISKQYQ
ncbi:hypothetical protein THRCLA_05662 [Thraustotheca clavata]|uniref:Uncharacterized protein n=1 Tax=Thraustotheca clavata TaxID=74557 RepID=A0A1V9ZV74_9STRA|nr:hypothetical protein THRCLA_05662 [Thraustotheca clavata]